MGKIYEANKDIRDPEIVALKKYRKELFKTKKGRNREFTDEDLNWDAIYELKRKVTEKYEKSLTPSEMEIYR